MLRAYSNLLRWVFLGSAILPACGAYIAISFTKDQFTGVLFGLLYLFVGLLLTYEFHRLLAFFIRRSRYRPTNRSTGSTACRDGSYR